MYILTPVPPENPIRAADLLLQGRELNSRDVTYGWAESERPHREHYHTDQHYNKPGRYHPNSIWPHTQGKPVMNGLHVLILCSTWHATIAVFLRVTSPGDSYNEQYDELFQGSKNVWKGNTVEIYSPLYGSRSNSEKNWIIICCLDELNALVATFLCRQITGTKELSMII